MSMVALRDAKVSLVLSSGLIITIETRLEVIRLFQLMHALPGYCGWRICDSTSATDANTTEEESLLSERSHAIQTENQPIDGVVAVILNILHPL